jgi:hypothetical protein
MINKIIRNYIAKRMAGRSDDGIMITLKDPQRVTLGENIMADLLMRNGIDPRAITSEAQLKTILQQIENAEAAAIRNTGIRNTESAKVFNIEGQKLDPNKPIIGGTQTGKELSPELSERLRGTNTERIKQRISDREKVRNEMKEKYGFTDERLNEIENTPVDDDLPPPGSRGGPDDIATPIQSAEESLKDMTEAEIKKNIEARNKKGIENILKRKNRKDVYGLEDYDTTNMSDIKKEIIRTETKLGNLNPDDPGFREKAKPLVDKITELQKKLRDDKAEGGIMRLGLKEGSGMTRRTFLKFLAGAASIPIVGKIFKPFKVGKTVTKVPIIKTADVAGKPEWFDQLVNKVILEGDDVTKKFATGERQVVHVKKLDEDTTVRVTQDMDQGAVRVEYESPENVYGDPVQMQYKKPLPDEGAPNPAAEFDTAESGPVGRADGPDDYSIDIDEVGGTSISDLTSDVSKLKQYATGQKPTLKEIVQIKKRKDRAKKITEGGENEMDEVIRRQGEFIENDLVDLDPGDFASGGIARMLGE